MAADLYLDFGSAFNWNASQPQHVFQATIPTDDWVNAPTASGQWIAWPTQLSSLLDGMVSRNRDYDKAGPMSTNWTTTVWERRHGPDVVSSGDRKVKQTVIAGGYFPFA